MSLAAMLFVMLEEYWWNIDQTELHTNVVIADIGILLQNMIDFFIDDYQHIHL